MPLLQIQIKCNQDKLFYTALVGVDRMNPHHHHPLRLLQKRTKHRAFKRIEQVLSSGIPRLINFTASLYFQGLWINFTTRLLSEKSASERSDGFSHRSENMDALLVYPSYANKGFEMFEHSAIGIIFSTVGMISTNFFFSTW